ncbi:hypothetical protein [Streptomyces sp. NPDC006668]|uniref:hypothetical protein n=1 Tax=Streptomyces sp. NPDC006668 TaxID=3156903 RepID=UPI003400D542
MATHAGVALVALFVGVLIGVVGSSGTDKTAAPAATVTQTVAATPGVQAAETSSSSPASLAFGDTWTLHSTDPAKPFEAQVSVLGYQQGFTSVGSASQEAGASGYVWAYTDLKLCVTKGSYTDDATNWTLYYRDGSRVNPSSSRYGDFPKPEFPAEVTVTAGTCARGKLVFPVPGAKRPRSVLYAPEGLGEQEEWTVPRG